MRKQAVLVSVLIVILLLLAGCSGSKQFEDTGRKAISWGSSSVGSGIYVLSVGMADIITKNSNISVSVESIGGSDATVRAIGDKKVDVGTANSFSVANGFNGTQQFKDTGPIKLTLLAKGYPDSLRQLVVRKDSRIKTPADLAGKQLIAIRKAMGEIELVGEAYLKAYGVPKGKVKFLETAETNEAIEALKVGSVEAAIIPASIPASYLTELAQTTEVSFVSLPDDKLKSALEMLGSAFSKGVVPPNTYKGQNNNIAAPGLPQLIVARADLPENIAYEITKAIMDHPQEVAAVHQSGKAFTIQNSMTGDAPIPFHPGAVRYYKEVGAWREGLPIAK